jgi:hypothetical protein
MYINTLSQSMATTPEKRTRNPPKQIIVEQMYSDDKIEERK